MFILPGQSYQPVLPFLPEPTYQPPWIKLLQGYARKNILPNKLGKLSYTPWKIHMELN